MNETLKFIMDNWVEGVGLLAIVGEIVALVVPTEKNRSIVAKVLKVLTLVIGVVNRKKGGGKFLTLLFLFTSSLLFAQNNSTYKAAYSYNADSTTVKINVGAMYNAGLDLGAMYYNHQSNKWRVFQNGVWKDLISVSGGGGGSYAFENGLTLTGSTVTLGGTLNDNTSIAGDGYTFSMNNLGSYELETIGGQLNLLSDTEINLETYIGPGTNNITLLADDDLNLYGTSGNVNISASFNDVNIDADQNINITAVSADLDMEGSAVQIDANGGNIDITAPVGTISSNASDIFNTADIDIYNTATAGNIINDASAGYNFLKSGIIYVGLDNNSNTGIMPGPNAVNAPLNLYSKGTGTIGFNPNGVGSLALSYGGNIVNISAFSPASTLNIAHASSYSGAGQGAITISGSTNTGAVTAGGASFSAGSTNNSSGTGGTTTISGGASSNGVSGTGGNAVLRGGNATAGTGGNVSITSGTGTVANGSITIDPGTGASNALNLLNFPKVSTYTPTWTGFSVDPTTSASYVKVGKLVTVWLTVSVAGTSNATTCTVTLPSTSAVAATQICFIQNGGSSNSGRLTIAAASNIVTGFPNDGGGSASSWSNTLGKYMQFTLTYLEQ